MAANICLGMAMMAVLALAGWWVLHSAWSVLSGVDKTIIAALVTGTIIATGAICVKHIEHRHGVDAQFREHKVELFNEFVAMFNEVSSGGGVEARDLAPLLVEWKRKLLFWGGPKAFRGFLALGDVEANPATVGGVGKSMEVIGNLLLAMRRDVGLSNRGIVRRVSGVSRGTVFGARYIMRRAELFLRCLRSTPDMALSELVTLEKELDAATGV